MNVSSLPSRHCSVVSALAFLLGLLPGARAASFTFNFDPTQAGVAGSSIANWSYDVKNQGPSDARINADIDAAGGAGAFDSVRVAWYPQYALVSGGTALSASAKAEMDDEARRANLRLATKVLFLSPKTGSIDPWYVNANGTINVSRWVTAMELSRDYYKNTHGKSIVYNGACNEPDNTGGKFTATIFNNIRNAMSGWGGTVQVGPCAYEAGAGANWLGTIHTKIDKASTHAIGGTTQDDYRNFDSTASGYGLDTWNSEAHNLAEALVGAYRNFKRVCWWAAIDDETGNGRGRFMRVCNNNRLFYYNDFNVTADGKWTNTSCYKDSVAQSVWIFIGNKTNNSLSITYHSTSIAVSYNGSGFQTNYTVTVAAAGNPGSEQAIHVTW